MIGMEMEAGIWRQAKRSKAVFHVVHDADVSSLDRLISLSMARAADNRTLAKDLWNLRLSILQTLLPLGAPQLGLKDIADRVLSAREVRDLRTELEAVLKTAFGKGENPKKAVIDGLFCDSNEGIEVWNRPWNQSPLGWPPGIQTVLDKEYGTRLSVIAGIRDLPDAGSQLILTSPLQGKRFPPANAAKLLRPGRWTSVHILRYAVSIEADVFTRCALDPPLAPQVWCAEWDVQDSTVGDSSGLADQGSATAPAPADNYDDIDPQRIFGAAESATGEPARACLVRLSSAFCVAHANDDQVPLLNGRREWIPVLDLVEGDLIPVGIDDVDRQLLEQGATARMGRDNVAAVRRRIGGWKQVVRTCLIKNGQARLRNEFNRFAAGNSEAWRIDAWSDEKPWAPRSKKDFKALILAAHAFGFFLDEDDIGQFIANSWRDVQSLRNAHRLAGRDMVNRLEDELEQEVAMRDEWKAGDEVGFENGGRKYRVCEVVGVSDAGMLYPGQLRRLKKWHE